MQCKRGEGGSPRIRVTNARVCTPPRHPPRPPKEVNAVGRHFATRSDAIQMRRMRVADAAPLPFAFSPLFRSEIEVLDILPPPPSFWEGTIVGYVE